MALQIRGVSVLVAMLAIWVAATAAAKDRGRTQELTYEGTIYYQGHYPRPGEARAYHSAQRYMVDRRGRARFEWSTWSDTDTARVPESYLVAGDSVFHRESPTSTWELLAGEDARVARLEALAGVPSELKALTLRNPNKNRTFRRNSYIDLHAHPRLGDVRDSVIFTYGAKASDPSEMLLVLYKRDSQYRTIARRVESAGGPIPDSMFQSPARSMPERSSRVSIPTK